MPPHALIGGGTGFIGKNLAAHLIRKGYEVTIISRMPGLRHITWHELEKNGIPSDVHHVINLAGQNVLDPTRWWTEGFKQNVWNSRVNSAAALTKAVTDARNVRTYVNIFGVSHYKPNEEKIYVEADEVEGYDFMSVLCLEWERAATLQPDVRRRIKEVKIRSGVVIGRDGGIIKSIWTPFKLGVGGPLGNGKQILPWIHIEDLCRLIQFAIESENCEGVLNGVAPEIVTNKQFSKAFAKALHRPCIFAVPEFIIQLIFGSDRSSLLLTGAKIKPHVPLQNGFQYKYPTIEGACEAVVNGN